MHAATDLERARTLLGEARIAEAEQLLEPILRTHRPGAPLDRTQAKALHLYAVSQHETGRYELALRNLDLLLRNLKDPGPELRRLRLDCLARATELEDDNRSVALVSEYLTDPDTENRNLEMPTAHLLVRRYGLDRDDARIDLAALAGDAFFRLCVASLKLPHRAVELFLIDLRRTLLGIHRQDGLPPAFEPLIAAMATRGWYGEYVSLTTPEEHEHLEELKGRVREVDGTRAALERHGLTLGVCAMYEPIGSLLRAPASRLADPERWPPFLRDLVRTSITEPQRERELRGELSTLRPIEDPVSLRVRDQYERHPYPRWNSLTRFPDRVPLLAMYGRAGALVRNPDRFRGPEGSRDLPSPGSARGASGRPRGKMRRRRAKDPARAPRRREREPLRVLVAGCGTGRHPLALARNVRGIRITALDLCASSLAYAARMAEKLGIGNVSFVHGDLLDVAELGGTFDAIEAVGVLHHMAEPEAGLRALLTVLRPGGLLRLGLYSAYARAEIARFRDERLDRARAGDPAYVRALRHELLLDPSSPLTEGTDFYSLSECRDLLFHVQEHRYTIPEIDALLARNGLAFRGFVSSDVRLFRAYGKRFPEDGPMTDLGRWARFEAEAPRSFAGMYQFLCQRDD